MPLTVLVVHNEYQHSGGEANVMAGEIQMLREHGDSVTVYGRNNGELDGWSLIKKLSLVFSGVFSMKTYREVRQILKSAPFDVVHVHNTVPLISPSVYYAAWSMGVPVVQTIHNYRFLCPNGLFYRDGHICEECVSHGLIRSVCHGCYRNSRGQSLALAFSMGIHRILGTYKRIEAFICLTEFAREKLSRLLPPERIYLKPNPVNDPIPGPSLCNRKKQFCCVTRLDREKGVYVLLEAFRLLPDVSLLIAGDGMEMFGMEAMIARFGMKNVTMAGNLDHSAAKAVIAESYAMILPTQLYEGFPMTMLESLYAGTPVIGSDVGAVAECLRKSQAGLLFVHDDPASLAAMVQTLTPERWELLHEKALLEAFRFPDGEENYQRLTDIYRKARSEHLKKAEARL